jgi:GntR family transcriptional regulator
MASNFCFGARVAVPAGSRGSQFPLSLGPAANAVRDRLLKDISSGELAPGQRLGAERELAEQLGVSRSTVRAAVAELARTGAVRQVRGRAGGIFVAERKVERDLTSLASLPAYLRRSGFQSDTRVISTAMITPDAETAAALGLGPDDLAHEVVRVRLADGERISLERATFPAGRFPDLLDRSLSGSLYELFSREYGLVAGEAEERIEVVNAGPSEARLLGVREGTALLAISRTTWTAEDEPFEFSHDLFRGDRVRIVVRARSAAETTPSLVASAVEVR